MTTVRQFGRYNPYNNIFLVVVLHSISIIILRNIAMVVIVDVSDFM